MGESFLSRLLWGHDLGIVHVYLIDPVVHLTSIELSEDMLSEVVVAGEVTCIMASEYFVELSIDWHLVLRKLLSELVGVDGTSREVLNGLTHLLLEGIECAAIRSGHLVALRTVKVDIIGVYWGHECLGVLLEILIVVEGLGDLGVLACAHLLCAHIIDELFGRLHTHSLFNLLDELVRIELASVELLKHII